MTANDIIQLLGILYLIFGLAFIFNKKYYKDIFKEIVKSKLGMFMGGYAAMVLGFVIILHFNEWSLSREGLVTFVGWVALIKGITILLFPIFMIDLTKSFTKPKYFDLTSFGISVIGLGLIFLGFLA